MGREEEGSRFVETGNESLDRDLLECGLFFETEVIAAREGLLELAISLPWWGPGRGKQVLPVSSTVAFSATDYTVRLASEGELIAKLAPEATRPTLMDSLRRLYTLLELSLWSADLIIRDYCYEPFDPRHWGRSPPSPSPSHHNQHSPKTWPARALYPFSSVDEQELDLAKDEVITILANLGNGWLRGERREGPQQGQRGLVPENYVERLLRDD